MKKDKPTNRQRVEHVIAAIHYIQNFSKSHTSESFYADDRSLFASLYQYTIIGEATFQIEYGILEKYDYPWHKVKAFRNFILHEYHALDLHIIWHTTHEVLPGLLKIMEKILETEFGEEA